MGISSRVELRRSVQLAPVDLAFRAVLFLEPIVGSLKMPVAQESFVGAIRRGVLFPYSASEKWRSSPTPSTYRAREDQVLGLIHHIPDTLRSS